MATPVEFPEQNANFSKPVGWTDEQCLSLPAYTGEVEDQDTHKRYPTIISCWQFSPAEMEELNRNGGKCWLNLVSDVMVPASVFVGDPFTLPISYTVDIPYEAGHKIAVTIQKLNTYYPKQPERGGEFIVTLPNQKAVTALGNQFAAATKFDVAYEAKQGENTVETGVLKHCCIVFCPTKYEEGKNFAKIAFDTVRVDV